MSGDNLRYMHEYCRNSYINFKFKITDIARKVCYVDKKILFCPHAFPWAAFLNPHIIVLTAKSETTVVIIHCTLCR